MAKNYVLTGCIPIGYGGLTTALLNRSAQISSVSKEPVKILTFRDREFPQAISQHLAERNGLRNGVTVTNIYDWLREYELTSGGVAFDENKHKYSSVELNAENSTLDIENGIILRQLISEKNLNGWAQVNHLRKDGTIAVIDNRRNGQRNIISCNKQGKPQRVFSYSWPFYHAWLDTLFGKEYIDIIVDNDHEARFLTDYQRPNISIIHYFHGTHCNDKNEVLPYAEFVFSRLDRFDLFVFPTFSQCYHAQQMFPHYSGFSYVPHALPSNNNSGNIERVAKSFVVASRLEPIKRLDHAILAIGEANKRSDGLTLNFLGNGSLESQLKKLSESFDEIATFHGHCSNVPEKLKEFSFYILTSISEGLPVALLEAMQAGCLPIAYNINFGPSDVIVHGVNGWLVEPGNIQKLSEMIEIVSQLPEEQLKQMRENAKETAEKYSVSRVLSDWNTCKLQARKRKAEKLSLEAWKNALKTELETKFSI